MILTFTSSVNRSRTLVFYRVWTDLSFLSGKRTSIRAYPLDPRVPRFCTIWTSLKTECCSNTLFRTIGCTTVRIREDATLLQPHFSWAGLDCNWQLPFLKKRKEKRKYAARPGIEPRTPESRVRCPTDCATRPGEVVLKAIHLAINLSFNTRFQLQKQKEAIEDVRRRKGWARLKSDPLMLWHNVKTPYVAHLC